jgi:hypothetical protein
MLVDYFELIPTIPDYVPLPASRERARARFASFVGGPWEALAVVTNQIEFISCLENFKTISCPACGAVLAIDWWEQAMDDAYIASRYTALDVPVPCCGALVSLNEPTYHLPQGFARFVLCACGPEITNLQDGQMRELEDILGCKLRKIWAA